MSSWLNYSRSQKRMVSIGEWWKWSNEYRNGRSKWNNRSILLGYQNDYQSTWFTR